MRETQSCPHDPFPELPEDLNNFAARLAEFKTQTFSVNRDQLLFQAGMIAARQERLLAPAASMKALRRWKAAALVLTALSASLATTVAVRPTQQPHVAIIATGRTNTTPETSANRATIEKSPSSIRPEVDVTQENSNEPRVHESLDVSWDSHPQLIEGLRTRQNLIAQISQAGTPSEVSRAARDDAGTPVFARPFQPPLTTRSLMMSVRSKNWINRLIEEPQL